MAEVWFIRHGESLSNAGHVVKRTETTSLTPLGQEQAVHVSKEFHKPPSLIVTTPYLRTLLTAAPTLEKFPETRHEVWPLHEFSFLNRLTYANTTQEQRAPFVKSYWDRNDPDYSDGMGAESFNEMAARILHGFERLRASSEDFITVFTHGHIMRVLRFLIESPQMPRKELMALMPGHIKRAEIKNCSIIRAQADKDGVRLCDEDRKKFQSCLTP